MEIVMYSYPHHIGDFIKDTARLNDRQVMTYLRLIWHYYDTEEPLSSDIPKLCFTIGACPEDAQLILEHFFYLDGDVYRHKRCDAEIQAYRGRQEHGRSAAKSRWKNAQSNADAMPEHARSIKKHANREPITDNHIKTTTRSTERFDVVGYLVSEGVDEQTAKDWIAVRKAKKAAPTKTAIDKIKEAAKKGGFPLNAALEICCQRGWAGFDPSWLEKNMTFKERDEANAQRRFFEMAGVSSTEELHKKLKVGDEVDMGPFMPKLVYKG